MVNENTILPFQHFKFKKCLPPDGIPVKDQPYTAFEANGKLYQNKIILFGLTNAVPWFQRIINDIIERNNWKERLHISITSLFVARLKQNTMQTFSNFLNQQRNIILPLYFVSGYQIHNCALRPDPERVKSLLDIPVPKSKKELSRQSASSHIMQNGCLASLVK